MSEVDLLNPQFLQEPSVGEKEAAEAARSAEGGRFELLPPGEYLCEIVKVEGKEKQLSDRVAIIASVQMRVVEPAQFAGKTIFDDIWMYAPGEKDGSRKRRHGILIGLGVVAKENPAGLSAYHFGRLPKDSPRCVYALGHRAYEHRETNSVKLASEAADFVGFHAANRWGTPECQPAPQAWPPRDPDHLLGVSAPAAAVGAPAATTAAKPARPARGANGAAAAKPTSHTHAAAAAQPAVTDKYDDI